MQNNKVHTKDPLLDRIMFMQKQTEGRGLPKETRGNFKQKGGRSVHINMYYTFCDVKHSCKGQRHTMLFTQVSKTTDKRHQIFLHRHDMQTLADNKNNYT